ncbi:MAG: hypothetical protein ABSF55_00215 [Candidatus Staskawiczbacteria bacterium]|jgi:hypothetical protein
MKKIFLILLIIIIILIIVCIGGYFIARYYLSAQIGYEYLFVHPTIAKIFQVAPICPATCVSGGVCGKDGKNYCNQCIAFQHGAGYAYDGKCKISYKNSEYGFGMTFPATWQGFIVQKNTWKGWKINGGKIGDYSGVEFLFKNPQTTASQQYQDIPIMVFTPDVWKLVSGNNPSVAISAAPIGPAEVGENSKYVFATPPRWYGFTSAIGFDEAVQIVKTFKAF